MISIGAPRQTISTRVQLPGSKSISNRLLILNAITGANAAILGLSDSEDTLLLQKALEIIKTSSGATIDVNHAGTDMRFLTALLSVTPGEWLLTGSARLKERPVADLVNALRQLGAEISYAGQAGFPPLAIKGKKLEGGKISINAAISSQFISALLLISPALLSALEIKTENRRVSQPYIEMTLALLRQFGMTVTNAGDTISVQKNSAFQPSNAFTVEPDWSSASYWYSICALAKGSRIILDNLREKSLQADSVLPTLFGSLGVKSDFSSGRLNLTNTAVTRSHFEYDFTNCPDIAQTLAITCFALGIDAKLSGLQTLRIKETDRISAMKTELEKFGAMVTCTGDAITVSPDPGKRAQQVHLATYHDHRMAMSFAPLALSGYELVIDDGTVVAKSYPHYWRDLKTAGFSVNLQP